ncbi:MAG: hypothetical protein GY861_03060 [bacterium]|nr:hypothetical protein [bacterium]
MDFNLPCVKCKKVCDSSFDGLFLNDRKDFYCLNCVIKLAEAQLSFLKPPHDVDEFYKDEPK